MPQVCGVRFRGTGKVYFFAPPSDDDLAADDHVIVETARGRELAQVVSPVHEVDDAEIVGDLKSVVRRATSLDLLEAERYRQQAASATEQCQQEVAAAGLPMKIVGAEYSYDGTRLTFFFSAETRIDFRDLVRNLARTFKTRIELRQIGVRDEAKVIGGYGKCGRPLCCATWLTHFSPVSIRMAKQQDLPLSPMEISGCCGRLLCCLSYENAYYGQVKREFPKVGRTIDCPLGRAKVIKVSAIQETATLLLEDGTRVKASAEQLRGEEPMERPLTPMQRALESTLRRNEPQQDQAEESDGDDRPQSGSAGPAQAPRPRRAPDGSDEAGSSRRRTNISRRPPRPSSGGPTDDDVESAEEDSGETLRSSERSRRGRRSAPRSRRPAGQGGSGAPQQRGPSDATRATPDGDRPQRPSTSRRRRRGSSPRRGPQSGSEGGERAGE